MFTHEWFIKEYLLDYVRNGKIVSDMLMHAAYEKVKISLWFLLDSL